jgi:enterochelin esterase-like enzyme
MIKRLIAALFLMLAPDQALAGDATGPVHVSAGKIVDLGVLNSKYADPRRVVVWLPRRYSRRGPKYAVLYMHDGQNLFDKATAGYGMEWEIDEHLSQLIADKKVRPTIVVGIWNTPKRLQEYVPSKAFATLPPDYRGKVKALYGGDPLSDGYLKFIVRELRPIVDRKFNVKTDRANTVIMGSSMGSLISLYAIDEYPQVFGGAGMMSTHWPLVINPDGKPLSDQDYEVVSSTFERYLAPALPNPRTHKLYFDYGSETLDAAYQRYQNRVDMVVAKRLYAGPELADEELPGPEAQ